jgi:hypothetical protein
MNTRDNTVRYIILSFLVLVLICFVGLDAAEAQCPMCRMSAESNLQNGGTAGKGLNNGILYMLATPYLLIGIVGYVWWRNRQRKQVEDTIQFDEE